MSRHQQTDDYQRAVEKSFQEFFRCIMPTGEDDVVIKPEPTFQSSSHTSPKRKDSDRAPTAKPSNASASTESRATEDQEDKLELLHRLQKNLRELCQQRGQATDPRVIEHSTETSNGESGRSDRQGAKTHHDPSRIKGKRRRSPIETVDLVSDSDESVTREPSMLSNAPDGVADELEHFRIKSSSTMSLFESDVASENSARSHTDSEEDSDDRNMRCSTFSVVDINQEHFVSHSDLKAYQVRLKSIGKENGSAYRHAAGVMARIVSMIDESRTTPVIDSEQARKLLESEDPPTVVVVEGKDTGITIDDFLSDLETFHNTVSVQDSAHIGNRGRQGKKMSTTKLRQIFNTPRTPLSAFKGKSQSFQQPVNCLGISNPNPDQYTIQPPSCMSNPRWKLLQILCRRLADPENGLTISLHEPFVLLSQEDAISLPHQDRHGTTTYLNLVRGSKIWIYWELNKQERLRFRQDGLSFCGGRPRVVFLEEGQTLIMRPGTVHAVITSRDSLCFGGQAWDGMQLTTILRLICGEVDDEGLTTNEGPATGLFEILQEAQRITRTQRTRKPPPLCFLRASHGLFEETLNKVKEYCYDGEWQTRRKHKKRKDN